MLALLFFAISSLSDLHEAIRAGNRLGDVFKLDGLVTRASYTPEPRVGGFMTYTMKDTSGYCTILCTNKLPRAEAGDIVRICGHVGTEDFGLSRAYATSLAVVGHAPVPPPARLSADGLQSEANFGRTVEMSGYLYDIVPDGIDPRNTFLVLRSDNGSFLVSMPSSEISEDLRHNIGATVSLTGIANTSPNGGKRRFRAPYLALAQKSDIRIIHPVTADPFDVPDISDLRFASPAVITRANRRRADGTVIAIWKSDNLLLRTEDGQLIRAQLRTKASPAVGDCISVVGFPGTDLFLVTLTQAEFRQTGRHTEPFDRPTDLSLSDILSGPLGEQQVRPSCIGTLVRLTGHVITASTAESHSTVFYLTDGERLIMVDASSSAEECLSNLSGCLVEATGVCIMNTENWQPLDQMPRIRGLILVPRSGADIRILSRPSWWTLSRLFAVILGMGALLIAALIWNRGLQHLVERRGRQLFKAEIAQAKANLRVEDRTRLAADIHDSIAQTLTGVGFQIDASAKTLKDEDKTACANFLAIAKRTLLSCREELRRCIWDLRARSLEVSNLTTAITETIHPVLGSAAVTIRFNVPRSHLSDTTTHALLCIVRELVANAVRHGQARHIRIAGEYRDERVRFSVTDDGCGFNPENHAGPSQGHFGLQGIRERLSKLGGRLALESTPGKGSHIIVEIGK